MEHNETAPDMYKAGRPAIKLAVLLSPDKLSENKWRAVMRTASRWKTPKVLFAEILWRYVHKEVMEN